MAVLLKFAKLYKFYFLKNNLIFFWEIKKKKPKYILYLDFAWILIF